MKEFLKTCLHSSVKMWINLLAVINLLPCLIPLFSERHLWRLQEDVTGPHLIILRNTFAMPTIKTCLKERKFIKNLCKYDKKIKKRVLKLMNFFIYSTKHSVLMTSYSDHDVRSWIIFFMSYIWCKACSKNKTLSFDSILQLEKFFLLTTYQYTNSKRKIDYLRADIRIVCLGACMILSNHNCLVETSLSIGWAIANILLVFKAS